MGKYAGCLTSAEVCELECAEAKEILTKHDVSKDDIDTIIGMITEAYFQLDKSFKSAKVLEDIIKEGGTTDKELIKKYLEKVQAID